MAIAVPATASIAAAVVLSPQAFASTAAPAAPGAGVSAHTTGVAHAAVRLDAKTVPAVKAKPKAEASGSVWYTVQSGDTLSGIAGRFYQNSAAWPTIFWANKGQLASANLILPGQQLRVPPKPATIPAAPATPAAAPAPVTTDTSEATPAPVQQQQETAPVQQQSAPVQATQATTATSASTGSSSFQQCVISRESGGNSQVMNSSGHYGLYQFSYSTWVAYGGSPSSFGNASVAQQNQVFDNAIAAGGQSNWAPYDGC